MSSPRGGTFKDYFQVIFGSTHVETFRDTCDLDEMS